MLYRLHSTHTQNLVDFDPQTAGIPSRFLTHCHRPILDNFVNNFKTFYDEFTKNFESDRVTDKWNADFETKKGTFLTFYKNLVKFR